MTTNFKFDLIENENKIFSWAEASLDFYNLTHSVAFYFRSAAHHFIGMLSLILALVVIPLAIVLLIVLLSIFSTLLVYHILLFSMEKRNGYKSFDKFERRDLIDFHFKTNQSIRKMESLKSSDFLFKTPVVGFLLRKNVANLLALEVLLKSKAYPNHGLPPKHFTVHEYDPNDPWQKDLSDLKRYQNLPTN